MKSAEEIMEILEAYDLTGSLRDAAELAGCSHHTVAEYVAARERGELTPGRAARREMLVDPYLDKLEEWVDRSRGKVRGDVAHEKLVALGYAGSQRTTRRAVAEVKAAYRAGRRRVHRPWITEPGMWFQYDFGDGPRVRGVGTQLFCAWLAWCRFRVVLALLDKTLPSVMAAIDTTLRVFGGVPTYALTDNEKTVTSEHVAGIPVRNAKMLDFARHYGLTIATCVPADPASKGGSENAVKIAKADLVPCEANLLHPATSAELAIALNPTRATRRTRRQAPPLGSSPCPLTHRVVVDYLSSITPLGEGIVESVRTIVRQLLPTGAATLNVVAEQFHLHPKTLQRRLAEENTTFVILVDRVRKDVADRYLRTTGIGLTHLARELGYAEQSVLTRSCKRWFGTGPAAYRNQARLQTTVSAPGSGRGPNPGNVSVSC